MKCSFQNIHMNNNNEKQQQKTAIRKLGKIIIIAYLVKFKIINIC